MPFNPSSFLLLVAMPGAPSSVLAPSSFLILKGISFYCLDSIPNLEVPSPHAQRLPFAEFRRSASREGLKPAI